MVCSSIAACGDDGGGQAMPEAAECVSGTSFICVGPGNCSGRQSCVGGMFTDCRCSGPAAGNGPSDALDAALTDAAEADGSAAAGDAAAPEVMDAGPDAAGDAGQAQDAAPDAGEDANQDANQDASQDANQAGEDAGEDAAAVEDSSAEGCPAARCVPVPPAAWVGPVALYAGVGAPPACGGDYGDESLTANGDLSAAPAACSTCSCEAGSCASLMTFAAGSEAACADAACAQSVNTSCTLLDNACLDAPSLQLSVRVGAGHVDCVPSAQTPTFPDAAWATAIRACAPADPLPSLDCGGGAVCAPEAPAPAFQSTLCIHRDGDLACPAGDYTDRRVYFRDFEDDRSCSECACESGCGYEFSVYSAGDTTCASPQLTLSGNRCETVAPSGGQLRVGVTLSGDGNCDASGGEPAGAVTPSDAVTVCCLEGS